MDSILFIAPHKHIAAVAEKALEKMNLSVPVIVAKNQSAVNAAKKSAASVIISRGGTARDLKKYTDKIIVDINIAFADIFPPIEKLSSLGSKNIAIISNNHIIDRGNIHMTINDTSINIYAYSNDSDAELIVNALMEQKIDGIIGDIRPVQLAKAYNIKNWIYIESSVFSIEKAVKEALSIVESQQKKLLQFQTMQTIIDNIDEGIIVYNADKMPLFSNKLGLEILRSNPVLSGRNGLSRLSRYLDEHNGKILEIDGEKLLFDVIKLNLNNEINNDVLIFQKVNEIEKNARKVQTALYKRGLYAKKTFADILYASPSMKAVLDTAQLFSKSKSTVLIYGETGTGKEGMAQSIHNASLRAAKPFVSVNCASLPPTLIESELFGYVEGAFTGARRSGKKGLFEMAHTGTIFLDEIGDLPLDIQSRLLRVLQEREIMRVGDDKILPIDIRLICATNKNLKELVKEGKFRQDLYYRINVLRLTLPPLRKRKEDIPLLLNHYLSKYAQEKSVSINLPPDIVSYLTDYPWYGNVRELKNAAEVIAFIYKDDLRLSDVKKILDDDEDAPADSPDTVNIPIKGSLKDMEKEIVRQMIQKDYTPDEICARLGISKVTLWRKSSAAK